MGKGMYLGVGGKARKVKKMYVGVNTELPIYSESTTLIRYGNISQYFSVQDDDYAFKFDVGTKSHIATSTNKGIASSTAKTTLTAKQDMDINFDYSYSSEQNYDEFTLIVAGTTVENAVSGATTTKSYSGSLKTGQSIVFQYAKDSTQDKNDDQCTFSNMNVTVMIQTGTETKDVARKVKKAYIGVGGVARPCFSGGELVYYGTATPLSVARGRIWATSTGKYAFFSGNDSKTTVDAYNASLTRSTPTPLSTKRTNLAAASVGEYALFGGGNYSSLGYYYDTVDAYNNLLTHTAPSSLSQAKYRLAGTSVGNYALFGGGINEYENCVETVDAYNIALTKSTATQLSVRRSLLKATSVGGYALFGGGTDGRQSLTTVDAYNTSLTRSTPTELSSTKDSATSTKNYAFFGGGINQTYGAVVDVYNTSLVHTTPITVSTVRQGLAATSIGEYALFGGGYYSSTTYNTVDAYDASLIHSTPTGLNVAKRWPAASSIGNYALFGGGHSTSVEDSVDVYTIA